MSLNSLNQPLTRRAAARLTLALLCFALAGAGAWWGWRNWQSRPRDAAGNKEAIRDFLREQTGQRQFAVLASEAPTNSEPASAASASDSSKKDKPKKKKQPPPTDERRLFRQRLKEAADYKTVYRVIGEALALADQLLAAKSAEDKETGLLLAAEAAEGAREVAVNGWLAARIAEAYLWPGLEFACSSEPRRINGDYLLNIADDAFRAAEETNNIVRNYRFVIAHATKPGKGDNARFRLSRLLEEQGDFAQALAVLHEVQDTNASVLRKRMAALEQRLNAKPPAN